MNNQAQILYDKGLKEFNRSKMGMITTLLPQLVNAEQTAKFLEFNMDDEEKLILRVAMGPLYNVFNGNCTGHYALGAYVQWRQRNSLEINIMY